MEISKKKLINYFKLQLKKLYFMDNQGQYEYEYET